MTGRTPSDSRGQRVWHKAAALVPLALLSGAWTSFLADSSATASSETSGALPDGTSAPTHPVYVPADVSARPLGWHGDVNRSVSAQSTNGIPAAALAAYQRAAQVIDSADPGCNLSWPLIAAIGRVESDHGRYGGNVLTADGVASPGIFGPKLDGSNRTRRITDTDAGQYDGDARFDRAVGPMQFIPSTWQVVGVDGDGDHKRDPQDIDDAALASAVYLCSGSEDLSTASGQSAAVYRYNHSQSYVRVVRSIAAVYADGDYLSSPTNGFAPAILAPAYDDSAYTKGIDGGHATGHLGTPAATAGGPDPAPADAEPTGPKAPSEAKGGLTQSVDKVHQAATGSLTELQRATAYCTAQLTATQLDTLGLQTCTKAYLDGGAAAVTSLVSGLGGLLAGLLPHL